MLLSLFSALLAAVAAGGSLVVSYLRVGLSNQYAFAAGAILGYLAVLALGQALLHLRAWEEEVRQSRRMCRVSLPLVLLGGMALFLWWDSPKMSTGYLVLYAGVVMAAVLAYLVICLLISELLFALLGRVARGREGRKETHDITLD